MPVYLAHGFRWPRDGFTGIRVHAIVHNLEDVAVEYIQNERTKSALLKNFRETFPTLMQHLEDPRIGKSVDFLEQYDPEDELSDAAVSQKYAFVADRVITIAAGSAAALTSSMQQEQDNVHKNLRVPKGGRQRASSLPSSPVPKAGSSAGSTSTSYQNAAALSLSIEEAQSGGPAVTPQAWEAFAELRDKIAEGERIGWWVVYNGDPNRAVEEDNDEETEGSSDYGDDAEEEGARTPTQSEPFANGILGQPMPTMLPPNLKNLNIDDGDKHSIGMAIPHPPPPPLEKPPPIPEGSTNTRPKSSRSFTNPLKKKSSRANLQPSKKEEIPEPPKLKEINKKEGFRHKFFGRGNEKK